MIFIGPTTEFNWSDVQGGHFFCQLMLHMVRADFD